MLINSLLICFLSFYQLLTPASVNFADIVYFSDSGFVEFTSNVPMHSFSGESNHLTGMIDFEENIIDFYLDLNTLKTGIGRRDRDMYQTLNVKEHPYAEFNGRFETSTTIPNHRSTVIAIGDFTLNGVVHEIKVQGLIESHEEGLRLEAEWSLLLSEFDIEPPGILFYKVNDTQGVEIEVVLKPISRKKLSIEN